MGGRAREERARVLAAAGLRPAGVCATGIHATRHARGAFRTRPGEGAFMDPRPRRALLDSDPRSARVESNTRSTGDGASAGVDASR
jgi:hypothetical protein